MGYVGFVGWRYLRSRKSTSIAQITAISVFGVAMGVATLLVIVAISSGFLGTFRDKVLGVNAHVIVLKSSASFPEYREVMKAAEAMPGVSATAPFIINEMMIVRGHSISGILLKGIDPDLGIKVLELPRYIERGGLHGLRLPGAMPARKREPGIVDPLPAPSEGEESETHEIVEDLMEEMDGNGDGEGKDAGDDAPGAGEKPDEDKPGVDASGLPGIVIGRSLAENIGAKLGDPVRIISPVAGLDTSFWAPGVDASRSLDFRVIGIFYSGFDEYDSRLVYVDVYEAQKFYRYGDSVTGVEMKVRDIDDARDIALELEKKLGGGLYRTIDWEELNHNLFTALKVQKLALTVVLLLSVLMAALNIISTLIMLVVDKRKEIAILKSMGATAAGVMGIFMLMGTSIGSLGLALGMAIGYGACRLLIAYGWPLDPKVYLIDRLPVEINLLDYVMTAVVTMLICTLFSMIPSLHASRYHPVEGLKHE